MLFGQSCLSDCKVIAVNAVNWIQPVCIKLKGKKSLKPFPIIEACFHTKHTDTCMFILCSFYSFTYLLIYFFKGE
jgi:hypothetical protein